MREIAEIAAKVAELERRMSQMIRSGTVDEVDAANGLVRLKIGSGTGGDLRSPWVSYGQTGGALKAHIPPTVGQQMTLFSPSGGLDQAMALPMGFSDANPSPSGDGDKNVITFGSATITLSGNGLTIAVGGVTLAVTSDGVEVTGGMVKHNAKNIGSTHTHGGVVPGASQTSAPT
ncbi:MAG: hypothetical protein RL299_2125 [Pseudomonadota bacterium]|jgi:phage baseplate assembly protein V